LDKETNKGLKDSLKTQLEEKVAKYQRTIAVYGMITLRSDGEKVIIAQKKEKKNSGFEIFRLEPDKTGTLVFVSK